MGMTRGTSADDGSSSPSNVKLFFGNLTLFLLAGYHIFWKRLMAHGKKTVKNRLTTNNGIEIYRQRIAGAVRVLIPKMLCDCQKWLVVNDRTSQETYGEICDWEIQGRENG
jgi:hypothetical protein